MEQPFSLRATEDAEAEKKRAFVILSAFRKSIPDWFVGPLICIGTLILYAIAVAVGLRFVLRPEGITSVWPASGVALSLLALTDRRRWFWVLLGTALAEIPGNLGVDRPVPAVCIYAVANIIESLLAACILTSFGREQIDFTRVSHHLRLFLVAGPANAITAALAAGAVVRFGYAPEFWEFWRLWFVADGLGILLLTPVILSARAQRQHRLSNQRIIEATYLLAASAACAVFIFLAKRSAPSLIIDLPFVMTIPLILWAALRTNVAMTSWISLIFSTIAVLGTLEGRGPIAAHGGSIQSAIVPLQIVIMAWTICGLIVSVSTVQYRESLHKLTERETRFRLLADNSPAAVFLTNASGDCIYMNDRWEEITGQPALESLGQGWIQAVHPDDFARIRGLWAKGNAGEMERLAEYRVRRPSGEVRWINRRLAAVRSLSGVLQGRVGVAIDVTDQNRMERELEDRLQFEILIADISNNLVNVPADGVNHAVDDALRSLCNLLDVDRVTLSERSLKTKGAHIVRSHVRAGIGRDPASRTDAEHPWLWQKMDAGESVAATRLDDLPPEAAIDRATLGSRQTKSFIVVPLSIGGITRFAFSVATIQQERAWPRDLPRQLRVLGETIANSIIRAATEMDLRQSESMLRRLNSELLRAEDNERRRLAAALHDDLAQTLFASIAQLVAIRNKDGANTLAKSLQPIIGMLDDALRDTRDLTFELCPPVLYELGLSRALEKLTEQFHRRFGLDCRLEVDQGDNRLDSELAGVLYQAVRELLMNVVKHSGAKDAEIQLVHSGKELCITVSDNGKGMQNSESPVLDTLAPCHDAERSAGNAENLPSGFGLFNIRERMRSLGGRISVTSGLGKGCSVCLTLGDKSMTARAGE